MKRILNELAERADAAVDRSRLAALPQRYLDDVGMTVADRAAILGYEEPALDPWAVVASHPPVKVAGPALALAYLRSEAGAEVPPANAWLEAAIRSRRSRAFAHFR